jgi:hypothetical protein
MEDLKASKPDYAALIAKGTVGAIPVIGGLVAEIVGTLIPNQRMDRIARFLEKLEARVGNLESDRLKARLMQSEGIDLLEDTFLQASRALSDERLGYLSALLGSSILEDFVSYQETKRLLALLSELNDVEIVILASHHERRHPQRDPDFWERHKSALEPRSATYGSSIREIDGAAIREIYRQHLIQLQLLRPSFRTPRRGEVPEFDENTGMMKASGYRLTSLGRLLLRRIDMAGNEASDHVETG